MGRERQLDVDSPTSQHSRLPTPDKILFQPETLYQLLRI